MTTTRRELQNARARSKVALSTRHSVVDLLNFHLRNVFVFTSQLLQFLPFYTKHENKAQGTLLVEKLLNALVDFYAIHHCW